MEYNDSGRQWLIALVVAMVVAGLSLGISSLTSGGSEGGLVEGIGWVSWFTFVFAAAAVVLIAFGALMRFAGWLWHRARGVPVSNE